MKTTRSAIPSRLRLRLQREGTGQIIPILALMIVVTGGMVALAVDIGHVNQQRQQLQNTAVSAAEAGAYETYGMAVKGTSFGATQDHQVALVMTSVANNAGYTVANISSLGVYSAPPADPCQAGYTSSQVFLRAEYLDDHNTPIPNSTNPALVGAGAPPQTPHGIKVLGLGGCVPGFFSPIIGRKTFTVATTAQAGLIYAAVSTPPCADGACPPTLTETPTPTATATATNTPTATSTSSIPTATGTANPSIVFTGVAPFMVYGLPPTMLYAPGATGGPTGGDLVTLYANNGAWANNQYSDSHAGQSGTADGITVHDASMEGCLATQTNYPNRFGPPPPLTIGSEQFNYGGVGHCDFSSIGGIGTVVTIPLVYEVNKNDGTCVANGGYCEVVQALVQVTLTTVDYQGCHTGCGGTVQGGNGTGQHAIQGYISGIVYDPYGIVQLPPVPTATGTETATSTATPANTVIPVNTLAPPTATSTPLPPG